MDANWGIWMKWMKMDYGRNLIKSSVSVLTSPKLSILIYSHPIPRYCLLIDDLLGHHQSLCQSQHKQSILRGPSHHNLMKPMIRCRSISTVEGSGATCTRIFFDFFLKQVIFLWSSWPKKFKKIQKSKKNAKNAFTSHYANGHGDPCDKRVKNQLAVSTANQVHF